jgi:glycosyltransferase involved in cell wall biosynthesis
MKIAYLTTYDSQDLKSFYNWAGLGYYIALSLKQQSVEIDYIGPLEDRVCLKAACKLKRHYHQIVERKNYLRALDPITQRGYVQQVTRKMLNSKADLVFGATTIPISYLDCSQPTVFWSDATFVNLLDSYPIYKNLCQESIDHGHQLERLALQKCSLAIYSSDWAAQTAINYYQADPAKVKVVPFGANLENSLTMSAVKELIDSRPSNKCKLLFIGYDWFRKGGDIVVKLVQELNSAGLNTELTVIGCNPFLDESASAYVKALGIISKSTKEGTTTMSQLLAESHFLIMPSKAECYGIVFCEANSFGTPCIATNVGGIPTIIKDDRNGKLFDLNADIFEYCQYILNLFANYSLYKKLAYSTFQEYQSRLNWSVASHTVKKLLDTIQ